MLLERHIFSKKGLDEYVKTKINRNELYYVLLEYFKALNLDTKKLKSSQYFKSHNNNVTN